MLWPGRHELLRETKPLTGAARRLRPAARADRRRPVVLLGEASHGTHEFYRERALITRRLIEEKGFTAVAVEADWPDAYRVNRYVRGAADDGDAEEALRGFRRFPTWMWRNAEVLDFVGWLREHNDELPPGRDGRLLRPRPLQPHALDGGGDRLSRAGRSRRRRRAPAAATPASTQFGGDQEYGRAVAFGIRESCRARGRRAAGRAHRAAPTAYLRRDGVAAEDEQLLRRAERPRGGGRGGVLPGDVRRPRRVLEPARPPHGRHARRLDGHPRRATARRRRSSSGRTTPTSATRGRPRWASAASSTSAS